MIPRAHDEGLDCVRDHPTKEAQDQSQSIWCGLENLSCFPFLPFQRMWISKGEDDEPDLATVPQKVDAVQVRRHVNPLR